MKTLIFTTTLLFAGVLSEAQASSPAAALKLARTTYESVKYWHKGLSIKQTQSQLDQFTAWLFGFKANLVGLELDALEIRQLKYELDRTGDLDDYSMYHILQEHADMLAEAQPEIRVVDAWREVDIYPRDYGYEAGGHAHHLHERIGDEAALVFAASGLSDIAKTVIENKGIRDVTTDLAMKKRTWLGTEAHDEILADAKKMMDKTTRDRESLYLNGNLRIDDRLLDSIYAAYGHFYSDWANKRFIRKIMPNIMDENDPAFTHLDAAIKAAGGWRALDVAMEGTTQSARLQFSNSLVKAAADGKDKQLLSEVVLSYRLIRAVQKLEGGKSQKHARSFGFSKTPTDTGYSYNAHLEGKRVINFNKMQARIDSLRQQYPDNEELHNTLDVVAARLKLKDRLRQ